MSEGFVHSVKVPRLYKTAANIVKKVIEDAASLKQLIYEQKHLNVKALYALTANTLQHASQLEELIRKTQILVKETRLDPWLTRVLISELIWGKQTLQSEAKPILTIKKYEDQLRDECRNANKNIPMDLLLQKKVDRPRYVRINTLIMDVAEAVEWFKDDGYVMLEPCKNYEDYLNVLRNLGTYEFVQDFHIPQVFAFASKTPFHDHSGYHSGAIVLQDKASSLPAFLLNPLPGSVVLDTCAAPGMKTSQLAAIMQNKGKIYAVEKNDRRYKVLCDFVESIQTDIITTIHENVSNLDSTHCPDVEYILVDPSCSGSGMDRPEFDKNPDKKCDTNRLKSLQSFQVFVLRHSLLNFPKAKRLVYSTCSIFPEENEMVIDEILTNVGDSWKLIPIKSLLNGKWNNYSSKEFNCKNNCLYANADQDLTSGFFVAVFERNFDVPLPQYKKHRVAPAEGRKEEQIDVNDDDSIGKNTKNNKKRKLTNEVNEDINVNKAKKKKNKNKNAIISDEGIENNELNPEKIGEKLEITENEKEEAVNLHNKKNKKKKKNKSDKCED